VKGERDMKKVIAAIAVIGVLVGLVILAYVRQVSQQNVGPRGPGGMQMSVPVEVVSVTNGDIAERIVVTGAIAVRAEVEVFPKQSGELVELLVEKGQKVKAGQVLARIDSKLLEIQKKQAEADLTNARAAHEKTSPLAAVNFETSFKQAESELERLESLLKQSELDLELQRKEADAQLKSAKASLRIAEAQLRAAETGARAQELEQARVKAEDARRGLERMTALFKDEMVSQDQVEAAQLQYDINSAQLSLLEEGARQEDMEVLKAQVETAEAALESAKNNTMLVDIKESSLKAAKAQVASAKASFEQASAAKDVSTWEKEIVQSQASVQRAEAALELIQQHLEDSAVKAPISGIIADRFLDKGDTASVSQPFATIVDMDVVKIDAKISAQDLATVKVGDRAVIKPDAYPGEKFPSTVTNVGPMVDKASQTADVEFEAANPDHRLKPGMFTRAEITIEERKGVPVIPVEALVERGDKTFVYVIKDGKALEKEITTGISDSIRIEVTSGLEAGDEYIMAGKQNLREGISVAVSVRNGKPVGSSGAPEESGERPGMPPPQGRKGESK
jgi:HlyD family secretion protein